MANKDAPEERRRQEAIEPERAGVLLPTSECEERNLGQFKWTNLHILSRQKQKYSMYAIRAIPLQLRSLR